MQSRKAFLTFLVCSIVLITLIQEVRAQTLWDLIRNFLFPPLEPAVTGGTGGCVSGSCKCSCGANEDYVGSCANSACGPGGGKCCAPKTTTTTQPTTTTTTRPPTPTTTTTTTTQPTTTTTTRPPTTTTTQPTTANCNNNGHCDGWPEDCGTCPGDCKCGPNDYCPQNWCVPKPTTTTTTIPGGTTTTQPPYGQCSEGSSCSCTYCGSNEEYTGPCVKTGCLNAQGYCCKPKPPSTTTTTTPPGECCCHIKTQYIDVTDCMSNCEYAGGTCQGPCPCGGGGTTTIPPTTLPVQPEVCAGSCITDCANCEASCKAAGKEVKQSQSMNCDASHAGTECCCVCGPAGGTPPPGGCYSEYWKTWVSNGGTCCHSQAGSDPKAKDCHYDIQDTVKCVNGQFVHLSWSPCPSDKCCDPQGNCIDCGEVTACGDREFCTVDCEGWCTRNNKIVDNSYSAHCDSSNTASQQCCKCKAGGTPVCCQLMNYNTYAIMYGACTPDNFHQVDMSHCGGGPCSGICRAGCNPGEKSIGSGASAGCSDLPGYTQGEIHAMECCVPAQSYTKYCWSGEPCDNTEISCSCSYGECTQCGTDEECVNHMCRKKSETEECSGITVEGVGGITLHAYCSDRCLGDEQQKASNECYQKGNKYCCVPSGKAPFSYIPSLVCMIPFGRETGTCDKYNPYLSGVWMYAPAGTCTSAGQSCQANSNQCANTDTSCGFYPNCISCKDLEHCRGGYWQSYGCYRQECYGGSSTCTEECCQAFDPNAHCVSDGRHPPLCQVVPGPNVCCCYITAEKTQACISKTSCETEGSCISSCPCGGGTTTTTTLPPTCSCTSWSNVGCGQGGCASDQMYQTRSCTGTNCPATSQCAGPNYGSWVNQGCGASCGTSTCSATQQCQKKTDSYGCAADQYQCVSAVECGGTTTTTIYGTTTTTLPCLAEGQSGAIVPNHPVCCAGLTYSSCDAPDSNNVCPFDRCAGGFFCTNCGNGVCGLGENKCNCPQDCGGPTTTTLPTGIQCDECFANSKCKCTLTTGCTNGIWSLQNTQGTPLSSSLSQQFPQTPPATVEFTPNNTGTITVRAMCWTNNQVLTYTLQVKQRLVKCDDECTVNNNCYCSVTGCLDGTFTAVLGDTVLKWKDPIGSTSYSISFIPEKVGTIDVDVNCNNPVKSGTAQIPVTGKVGKKFSASNFKSKQIDNSYKLTLDYINNLNEDVIIVFTKNGDAVNKKFTAEPGSGTASVTFDCDTLESGSYMISWKAYKSSNKEDPIAWSTPDEMKEIEC